MIRARQPKSSLTDQGFKAIIKIYKQNLDFRFLQQTSKDQIV